MQVRDRQNLPPALISHQKSGEKPCNDFSPPGYAVDSSSQLKKMVLPVSMDSLQARVSLRDLTASL